MALWNLTIVGIVMFGTTGLQTGCEEQPEPKQPSVSNNASVTSKPVAEPIRLFNGKDLTAWVFERRPSRRHWTVGAATVNPTDEKVLNVEPGGDQLINPKIVGADLRTERTFKDFHLELKFMLPPKGNSGIFLLGQYELQVLHDPAADPANPTDMDVGGVARLIAPKVLVPITPGQWHTYAIDFRSPRFDAAGNKTENAKLIRVAIDGTVVHDNVEIPGPTPGSMVENKEVPEGPILLQGSEGPVAFRDIVITPR